MILEPGKFYRTRGGTVWCCYRLSPRDGEHAAARCVRLRDGSDEYFYADGRYDHAGERESCLIEEVPYPTGVE